MKQETKIAAAIMLLMESGYTVSKGRAKEATRAPMAPHMEVADPSKAMNVPEFMARYRVGRTITYEEINSGALQTYKVGRRRYISERAAAAWQESQEQAG